MNRYFRGFHITLRNISARLGGIEGGAGGCGLRVGGVPVVQTLVTFGSEVDQWGGSGTYLFGASCGGCVCCVCRLREICEIFELGLLLGPRV